MTALTALRTRAAVPLALACACAAIALIAGAGPSVAAAGIPVAGSASEPAVDPVTGTAFVAAGTPADKVAVIDMAAGTVAATIPVGSGPFALAVDPVTGMVYAANRFDDSVSVISSATDTVTATIDGLPGTPVAAAADPVTNRIYVELSERGTPVEIAVIDGGTSTLATIITLPAGTPGTALPDGVAVDSVTGTVYASFCGGGCHADIIDGTTGAITGQLAGLLASPPALADNPATGTVYVAGGSGLTAFNGATGARTATANLGAAVGGMAVNPSAGTVYVAAGSTIALLDATSLATTGVLPGKTACSLAVDPATDTLAIQACGVLELVALHPPAITSAGRATLTAGHPGTFRLAAAGTPPPAYTATGHLPAGVSLTTNGEITGTPGRRTGGIYTLTITASNGVAPAASQHLTLTIRQAPIITSPGRAWFKGGVRHAFIIRTSAYPAAAVTEDGKLPPGLRFATRPGGTALITGRPERSARGKSYRIRITARNGVGWAATQILTIHVSH